MAGAGSQESIQRVIERAVRDGPQIVTRHGRPVVRVVAVTLPVAGETAGVSDGFAEFLLSMPKSGEVQGLPVAPRRNRRKPQALGD